MYITMYILYIYTMYTNYSLGLILHEESLVSVCLNGENPSFVLDIPDLLLLTHFVGNSTSLKSHDHNWVPICLPTFNSGAYLQGYIAGYKLFGGGVVQKPVELTLVLIATSSDPELFKSMHLANEAFKQVRMWLYMCIYVCMCIYVSIMYVFVFILMKLQHISIYIYTNISLSL